MPRPGSGYASALHSKDENALIALDCESSVVHSGDSPFVPFLESGLLFTISFYDPDRMDNLLKLHT